MARVQDWGSSQSFVRIGVSVSVTSSPSFPSVDGTGGGRAAAESPCGATQPFSLAMRRPSSEAGAAPGPSSAQAVGEAGEDPGDLLEGADPVGTAGRLDVLARSQVVDELHGRLGVWLSKNSQFVMTTGA